MTSIPSLSICRVEVFDGAWWVDISSPVGTVSIDRANGDPGTLAATLREVSLDPAASTLLRPGRPMRVQAATTLGWAPVFTGTVDEITVSYDPADTSSRRAHITLTATDAVASLANTPEARGVAAVAHLRGIIPDRFPFRLNGATTPAPLPAGAVVSRNENASLWEQLLLTRDSVLGYAWVDKANRVCVFDTDSLPTAPVLAVDASQYRDIVIDFASASIINAITVEWLRYDIGTETATAIPYGPYTNPASIAEWGERQATFTIHGGTESAAAIAAYAASILARTSVPAVRILSVTIPIDSPADVALARDPDLNGLARVTRPDASTPEDRRITGIRHDITADRWLVTYDFEDWAAVTTPGQTPSTGISPIPPGSIREAEIADFALSVRKLITNRHALY